MNAHFSQNTIDFLRENKLRNDKAWFAEHKTEYNAYVIQPLASLAEALTPALLAIDDRLICSPKVGGSVSRIWRDTRFSKDKSLFRDTMWCMFVREKGKALPEFFFVIMPDGFLYGCGYYAADAGSMRSIRELILAGDKDFKTALAAYDRQDTFQIDGDMYKRSRYPDAPENLRDWLDRKTICLLRESDDFDLLFSDQLSRVVAEGYQTLAPVYRFLVRAEAAQPH